MSVRQTIPARNCAAVVPLLARSLALAVIAVCAVASGTPAARLAAAGRPSLPGSLREIVRSYPEPIDKELRRLKAGIEHLVAGRYEAAVTELRSGGDTGVTAVGDYLLLYRGRAELALDRSAEALAAFRELRRTVPRSPLEPQALIGEVQALLSADDPAGALRILDSAGLGENSETLYARARAHEAAGRDAEARKLYLRVYASFPRSEFAGKAGDRLAQLSPAFATRPGNYRAMIERAENLLRARAPRDSRTLLTRLANVRAPDAASSQKRIVLLADADIASGRTSAALPLLARVSDKDSALHAQSLYLKAVCYRRLDREKAFLEVRDSALDKYPDSSWTEKIMYSVATYFDVEGRAAEAEKAYRALWDRFPKGPNARRCLWKSAVYAYADQRPDEARSLFVQYLQTFGDQGDPSPALYWIARCLQQGADAASARPLFAAAAELAGESYTAQRAREALQGLSGEGGQSVPAGLDGISRFLKGRQPQSVIFAEPKGSAALRLERVRQLASAGLYDLAIAELRPALSRSPVDPGLAYAAARIEELRGDSAAAIAALRRVVTDYDTRPHDSLPQEVWDVLYPVRHRADIEREAQRRGLDPNVVLGMIRQESAFRADARSAANARGLMQILPSTGRRLARKAGVRYSLSRLHTPATNVAIGCYHFSTLMARFGALELALAAYNAGENRVERWLKEFGQVDMAEFVERIPFSETRGYVKQILTNAAIYRRLDDLEK